MADQSYARHAHRPTPTAVAGLCLLVAVIGFVMHSRGVGGQWAYGMGLGGLTAAVGALILISRLYTTALQDRIIRLEMRVRGAELLTQPQMRALLNLGPKRIAALRFASDAEIPSLLDRTVRESLTPDQIKRSITTWVADNDRT